jgi:uncharacterized heparinase superfamily protein
MRRFRQRSRGARQPDRSFGRDTLSALRRRVREWRNVGYRRGVRAASAIAARSARNVVRPLRLRRRPLSVSSHELYAALGTGDIHALLREDVIAALPTVAAFEHALTELSRDDRAEILAVAERIAAHTFDLLGSGPTSLGPRIDWSCDFKSGRRWPLDHYSRVTRIYLDNSDVKVAWELSRFQHLPVLAAAHRLTGDPRWLTEIAAQLQDWIDANPVEFGVNWACTMDVAIRAANWVATLALVADEAHNEPWLEAVLASLLLHGRFIREHLEWTPVRGNHYLSNVVGLLCVSAVFARGVEGGRWARWAAAELRNELRHQVLDDGCSHEASIPYHRLVTELFVCGLQASDALVAESVAERDRRQLGQMLEFVRAYTRPDGLAPQIGDADDGRFLPLGDYGRLDLRSHLHLFRQSGEPWAPAVMHAAFPCGGYWVVRLDHIYVIVRCGDVGLGGRGPHAHNDALSFEFALGEQPLVVDPGSYVYTADAAERNRFRSTAFHSTLVIDGAEQNPLSRTSLFTMRDLRRAQPLSWEPGHDHVVFEGRHHGYEALDEPATHTRRLEVSGSTRTVVITDTIHSTGEHNVQWSFPLAPCEALADGTVAHAKFASGVELEIASSGLQFQIVQGWSSPSYGRRCATPFVRASRRTCAGEDTTEITLQARGVADARLSARGR